MEDNLFMNAYMYKITKGDKLFFANNYASAEKVFNRTKNTKYPCGAFTRL